jgi:hypothetical protein
LLGKIKKATTTTHNITEATELVKLILYNDHLVIFKRVIISLVDNKIENRKIAHSSRGVMVINILVIS